MTHVIHPLSTLVIRFYSFYSTVTLVPSINPSASRVHLQYKNTIIWVLPGKEVGYFPSIFDVQEGKAGKSFTLFNQILDYIFAVESQKHDLNLSRVV